MISFVNQSSETTIKTLFGANCAIRFLEELPDNSVTYFHNLGYDINFIFEHTESKTFIKNGSFVYLYVCKYKGKTLEFRDSYAMIPSKLSTFPKMFGMKTKKEIMPYSLYKVESYAEPVPLESVRPHLHQSDWDEFTELAKPFTVNGIFDKKAYAQYYCERDVELLEKGMSIFRKNTLSEFDLDSFAYLTVSSLAYAYQLKQGCFEKVLKLGGCYREFIQASVKGGRCMTRRNEKFEIKETLNDFDGVSLYPSAMHQMSGYLKGKPKLIKKFEPEKYDHYYIKIKITKVNKHLDFPLISQKDENGILQYVNKCCSMYVDKTTLEDLIEFQGIEYEFLEGYYFDEGFNTKIKDTIKHMFNQRLKYKKEKNPIQVIYKLLMNSSYGKTIMKEHLTDDIIIHKDKYNDYVYRHHNYIKQIVQQGDQYWISKFKSVNNHMSFPHVGSAILSQSKRIMNRVFGVAHDNNIPIYYQDTDSMHMKDSDVSKLEHEYDKKYKDTAVPKLVGKGLGQFHCDFDLHGSKDPVSVKSIFLGKKTYIDILKDRKDKDTTGQHFRFKGIPGECIQAVANDEYSGDVFGLYKDMLDNKKKIKFDLCKGIGRVRPVFENRNGVVKTLRSFEREVQFV
jgi:hypothetical protein